MSDAPQRRGPRCRGRSVTASRFTRPGSPWRLAAAGSPGFARALNLWSNRWRVACNLGSFGGPARPPASLALPTKSIVQETP